MRLRSCVRAVLLAAALAPAVLAQDSSNTGDAQTTPLAKTTNAQTTNTQTQATTKPAVTITASDDGSSLGELPTATSSAASSSDDNPLGLPTITPDYTIPTVTPPPTAGAPYMMHSNLPEGTVFISVGSGLAFFALCTLAWRGLVAWSLHRSVQRAARDAHMTDMKIRPSGGGGGSSSNGGGGGFYAAGAGSTLSLDHLSGAGFSNNGGGGGGKPTARQTTPNSSLFFSPTAGAAAAAAPSSSSDVRRSTYLPAGYYAAGNRASVAPSNSSQLGLPREARYSRAPGVSPPGSPLIPRAADASANDSTTSLSLPPTGRAPSAYLEDLFDGRSQPGHRGSGRY